MTTKTECYDHEDEEVKTARVTVSDTSCCMPSPGVSVLTRQRGEKKRGETYIHTCRQTDRQTDRDVEEGETAVSITTIVANILSMLAISLNRRRLSANLRLICSLTLSDLLCGVGGILDDYLKVGSCEGLASKCLLVTVHLSALLTLFGLAVDHYLAICRPLYHRTDVNIYRVNVAIIVIWIVSPLCSSFEIITPVSVF